MAAHPRSMVDITDTDTARCIVCIAYKYSKWLKLEWELLIILQWSGPMLENRGGLQRVCMVWKLLL